MGWAYGRNYKGREIGYGVEAICDEPECGAKIDRGLAYCCCGLDGIDGRFGCGDYFCGEHLYYIKPPSDMEVSGQMCARCAERHRCAECWEDDEDLTDADGRLLCSNCWADK